jgi:hypothetical protein
MATDADTFNKDLYDLLKVRGYQPVPLDSKNQRVPASQAADVIQFTFTKDGEEYGKAWVSIDDAQNVIVYYDEEQQESPSSATPGVEYNDSWTGLLKHLKQWAQRRQLSFELSNKDRLGDDMRQRDYYKMKERLGEGKKAKPNSKEFDAELDNKGRFTKDSVKKMFHGKLSPDAENINEATAPFRKGDRIEVVKGEHAGELGTVLSVDKDYEMVKVTLDKFPNGRASANYDMFKKVTKGKNLEEGKTDHFGYEIKGNKKPWGLYHTKPNKPEKLVSKHHNKNAAEVAKWDQLGMGGTAKGEKFTVKKIPAQEQPTKESKKLAEIGDTEKGKAALGNYVKKASKDIYDKGKDAQHALHMVGTARWKGNHDKAADYLDSGAKGALKAGKRMAGVQKAVDRLVREGYHPMGKKVMKEEQLSEIGDTNAGKKALGSYVKKATSEIPDLDKERENHARSAAAGDWRRMKQIDKVGTKVDNRRQGVDRAISRLTKVDESYHPINKRTSYNDAIPSVKIILQHNRNIEEGEQRYRNVAKIYLENVDGERFLAPTTRPGIARVYARHIAEGGVPNDDKWNHIKSICEDYTKMAGFVRATRNGQFNESAQEFVAEGVNHYNSLRETLHKLAGHRGYQAYFESWTPTLMEDELDESINELFVQEMVDPRIESAMPILSRLKKPVTEMSEVDSLAEWAEGVINEKLELDEEEKLDEVGSISGDFMHSMTRPVRDLARKGGTKKALRRVVPGLGKREAGERAKDEKFHASLMKTAAPTYYDGEENPDYDMEVRSGKASEKAAKRYSNIAKGKKPFAEDGVNENLANWQMGVQSMPRTEPFKLKKIVVKDLDDPRSKTYTFDTEEEARRLFPDSWDRIKAGKTKLTVTGLDENFIGMAPQAVAEEEHLGEISKEKAEKYIQGARQSIDDLRWKSYGHYNGEEDGWDDSGDDAIKAGEKLDKREKMLALARAKKNKSGETAPHYTPHVKARVRATEEQVEEGKWDYPEHMKKTVTTSDMGTTNAQRNREERKEFRKKEKAKAHAELMKGGKKVDEGKKPDFLDLDKDGNKKEPMKKAIKDKEAKKNKSGETAPHYTPHVKARVRATEEQVEEDLDANQKRVGQLGPTEKVKNNNIGKLVGASESTEIDPELARIIEMARFKR